MCCSSRSHGCLFIISPTCTAEGLVLTGVKGPSPPVSKNADLAVIQRAQHHFTLFPRSIFHPPTLLHQLVLTLAPSLVLILCRFHLAATRGHLDCLNLILGHSVDVTASDATGDRDKWLHVTGLAPILTDDRCENKSVFCAYVSAPKIWYGSGSNKDQMYITGERSLL